MASREHSYRAYRALHLTFVAVPIATGTDKFFHLLTNWDQYLSPTALRFLDGHVHAFMHAVGVMEILIGIGMIFKPEIFSFVISAWLLGIVFNLLLTKMYFDVALRGFALVLATFALGELSNGFKQSRGSSKT